MPAVHWLARIQCHVQVYKAQQKCAARSWLDLHVLQLAHHTACTASGAPYRMYRIWRVVHTKNNVPLAKHNVAYHPGPGTLRPCAFCHAFSPHSQPPTTVSLSKASKPKVVQLLPHMHILLGTASSQDVNLPRPLLGRHRQQLASPSFSSKRLA